MGCDMATRKRIVVSIGRRKLTAYEDDSVFLECDCVTGRPGHWTMPGSFRVYRKVEDHKSGAYNGAPMPYSMFFERDGKAIHGTSYAAVRSYAQYAGIESWGSHGCVGVDVNDAMKLFRWAPINTPVIVEK